MAELQKINLKVPTTSPTSAATSTQSSPKVDTPSSPSSVKTPSPIFKIALPLLMIVAGIGTGYAVANYMATGSVTPQNMSTQVSSAGPKVGDVIGVPDSQTFKDSAEGVLEKGGLNGEGSHSLIRSGGASQTVYLTSSVIDLDELVGHKVKVWGETFKGQKVGWLMDVGRAQVMELNAAKPE